MSAGLLELVEVVDVLDTTADVDETPLSVEVPFAYPFERFDRTPVNGSWAPFAPRSRRFRKVTAEPVEETDEQAAGAARHPGVEAASQLAQWLREPVASVMNLAGLSESTYHWWRANPTAEVKPGKAGRLLRLHAVVGLLVRRYGVNEVRLWLVEDARQSLRDDPARYVEAVERDGYQWFRRSRRPRVAVDENSWATVTADAVEQEITQLRRDAEMSGRELAPEEPPER
jgi:hypothetical protein